MSLTTAPVAGTYTAPQLVTLTDAGSDAIYYTVDGSVPQYAGYRRDWNDGLTANQTNVSSNGTATHTNPGTFLRHTLTAAASSATSFLDSAPVPVFSDTDFSLSTKFRFGSTSCLNDTQACVVYNCAGKFAANDTYGYVVFINPFGTVKFARGSNAATGSYVFINSAQLPTSLAYDTWHTLTVSVSGQMHTVSVNGTVLGVWQDSTYTVPGYVGVRTYAASATAPAVDYDDFSVDYWYGSKYTAPVPVDPAPAPVVIKALSATAGVGSTVSSFSYQIGNLQVQQPTASVSNRAVTLSATANGATTAIGSTGKYTDARDGRTYKTVLMPDGNWWFAENFRYVGWGGSYGSSTYGAVHGRWYDRATAITLTPSGCHLPTNAEYSALMAACGGINDTTSSKLRSKTTWASPGTDIYGFGVLASGATWGEDAVGSVGSWGALVTSDPGNLLWYFTPSIVNSDNTASYSVRYIVDSGNTPDPAAPAGLSIYYTTDGSTPQVVTGPATAVGSTGTVTDPRDGKVYRTVLMPDGKWWLAENLAWAGSGSGVAFVDGRYLYWSDSSGAPSWASFSGTHLPSPTEWNTLASACGGAAVAGQRLRTNTWPMQDGVLVVGTNNYGFDAIPSGYMGSVGDKYEWAYGATYAVNGASGIEGRVLSSKYAELSSPSGISHYIAVRLIVDSGNVTVDVTTPAPGTSLYTSPIPYQIGMVISAIAKATGYQDSLPVTLYPYDSVTGARINDRQYLVTAETRVVPSTQPLWMLPKLSGFSWQTRMQGAFAPTAFQPTGVTIPFYAPPTTWTGSTAQPRLMPDEGIQVSVFPTQPTIFDNRVDWGNGPVTNRALRLYWRVPKNEDYNFAIEHADVKKALTFGDLRVDSQTSGWMIGGAQQQADLSVPDSVHYVDVKAGLGFVSGSVSIGQTARITGGKNLPPMAIWLSPGASNIRLNIPIQCNISVTDPDYDNINYVVTASGTPIKSGIVASGSILSFPYTPTTVGVLDLVITITDIIGAQTVVPAPALTVLDNDFPVCTFLTPANGTAVFHDTQVNINFDISDKENELMTWILLNNNVTIASGTSSNATTTQYRFKVPTGVNNISLVLADPLGAAPAFTGPTIYGSLCQITDVTVTGKTETGSTMTLTPTVSGTATRVDYAITTAEGTTNLSSTTAPYAVQWTPNLVTLPDNVVIVATAVDGTGHGPSITKTVQVTGETLIGSMSATEFSDTAQAYGVVISDGNMLASEPLDTFSGTVVGAQAALSVSITSTVPSAIAAGTPLSIEGVATDLIEDVATMVLEYQLPGSLTWVQVPMVTTEI